MARDTIKEKCIITIAEKQSDKMHETKKDFIDSDSEIRERFVGVDETDRISTTGFGKLHVLKTRCSSEQSLILKTSSLRRSNQLSTNILNQTTDRLNNNNHNATNNNTLTKSYTDLNFKSSLLSESKSFAKSTGCIDENKKDGFKKNANVYSVFQAKTVLKERRKSLPALPKLIGQKLHEHNQKNVANSNSSSNNNTKCGENSDAVSTFTKDFRQKTIRTLSRGIGRLLKRHSSVNISEPDPIFKVAYLGNVLTGWAKGEGCVDKPLSTLWRNYNQSTKPDVVMKLSITNSGLKGVTKEHGLTEYWAHRITFCISPAEFPKIFCWVYRHEGRKLKHELRCHAVLCTKESVAKKIATELQNKIHQALIEFKKDKIARQNARLSLANSVYENPSMPRRKILLSVGGNNYKPPLERSKSAPKLMAIEEMCSEEDEEEDTVPQYEINKNTWTKDSSPSKLRMRSEDMFPSHTLGRRKVVENSRKISLPESRTNVVELTGWHLPDLESTERDTEDIVQSSEYLISENRTEEDNAEDSYGFSESSESRDTVIADLKTEETDEDNEVFYCETDERKKDESEIEPKIEDKQSSSVDQLCQSNFAVLDSDEGSISSGCETASTVTTSDIEMNSLPCNIMQEDREYKEYEEKVSVLQRVQSYEQLFMRERQSSISSSRSSAKSSCSKKFAKRSIDVESVVSSDAASLSPSDSACFSSGETTGPPSCDDEVNLVPLGESYRGFVRATYLRCATYPPDDHELKIDEEKMDEEGGADSDSACSVESGYSELLDKFDQVMKPNFALIANAESHVC